MRLAQTLASLIVWLMVALSVNGAPPSIVNGGMMQASVAQDSSDFVKTSIIIASPARPIYSVFGHAALRMECPSAGLDYCFTFEMEAGTAGVVKFFFGQSEAGFAAVPTKEFLKSFKNERRQVRQYELNLTLDEKRELWRALDEDMMQGANRRFNMLRDNCVSMVMFKVESVMMNERFVCRNVPKQMNYKNGDLLKSLSHRSPWAQFVFLTFAGSEADNEWEFGNKLSPEMLPIILQASVIRNDSLGIERKAICSANTMQEGSTFDDIRPLPQLLTPLGVAVMLLVVTVLLTLGERFLHWRRVPRAFDCTLYALQSVVGVLLLYATAVSGLFGSAWNWLLIPFNPLPLLMWLCSRKRSWYVRCWRIYAATLILFIIVVPWITCQLLAAHYVFIASFMVRAGCKAINKP